jgi:O-acetyl-ADP-ribose deacetylase (regulator of RNase III)
VIHTVGPVWRDGTAGEPELLASCYRRSLEEAARVGARSIAFPGISTGIYGYPIGAAATIAVETVSAWLQHDITLDRVVFCTFDAESTAAIEGALES